MKSTYTVNNQTLYTDCRVQTGQLNRPFKMWGIERIGTDWVLKYRYLDEPNKGFDLVLDKYDNKKNVKVL